MLAFAFAGGTLLLAAVVIVVIVLANNKSTNAKVAGVNSYSLKLSSTLAPVVAANRTLSNALVALDGSQSTIRASRTATTQAQQVVTAARGALAVLVVSPASTQLSQQATQALTQENGYLQAVSTTLDDPTGNTVASLQPLASATNSAFVPLGSVAPGGNASIFGVDNLLKWTQGANALKDRSNQKPPTTVVTPIPTTTVTTPSPAAAPDPAPTSSLSFCDQNIQVDSQTTTCPLAENTFRAYWTSGGPSTWGGAVVSAYSPKTNQSYDMSCTTDQTMVWCTGTAGSSTLYVTFPMQAVQVY